MNEWRRYEPRGIGPSGRSMHTATAVGRKIYFFGGANSSGSRKDTSAFCDLYELDIGLLVLTRPLRAFLDYGLVRYDDLERVRSQGHSAQPLLWS